jgi:hypothetical protein
MYIFVVTCTGAIVVMIAHGEGYSIQNYVIKMVSDLWQVGGFQQVLQFPPPIKQTATI